MGIQIGLNCPACGGAIEVAEGESTVNCKYCSSTLFIEGDMGVMTIAFKNKTTREMADKIKDTWFKKGWKARDLPRSAKILEVYPIYLPFWYSNIRVMGWICGYEERTHSDGKHTHTERIPKEEMVLQDFRLSDIACDPGDLGIKHLKNLDGESSFEDFEMIPTYEATTSKDDSLKHMKGEALNMARAGAHVPHVTFERVHVLAKSLSMVYYPIWVVRYSYRERMYIYTVDGISGNLLSGRAPGDPLFQGLAITVGTSVGGLIAAGGLVVASSGNVDPTIGVVGVVAGAVITFGAYLFFRHGSEIIEGEFSDKKYGVGGITGIAKQIADITGTDIVQGRI